LRRVIIGAVLLQDQAWKWRFEPARRLQIS
jgi:hypothetical protein